MKPKTIAKRDKSKKDKSKNDSTVLKESLVQMDKPFVRTISALMNVLSWSKKALLIHQEFLGQSLMILLSQAPYLMLVVVILNVLQLRSF